jgi:hypothetical protein
MRTFLALASTLFLSACYTVFVPLDFQVGPVIKPATQFDAEVRAITVRAAPKEEQIEEFDWSDVEVQAKSPTVPIPFAFPTSPGTGIPITRPWEEALARALDQGLFFKDEAPRKVFIFVDVLKLDFSGIVTVVYSIVARYRILDRNTGQYVYSKVIESQGEATTGEAFSGAKRLRLSFTRGVTGNIEKFLEDLKATELGL